MRDVFPGLKVKVEWFIFYKVHDKYEYMGMKDAVYDGCTLRYRRPDLIIHVNGTKQILCCIELDGKVHTIHLAETLQRNDLYKELKIPLIVIPKDDVSVFDYAYQKVKEVLGV